MKTLIIASSFLALSSLSIVAEDQAVTDYSNAKAVVADTWVSVLYESGVDSWEVTAKVDKKIYNKLLSGEVENGWLELTDAYWSVEGKHIPQKVAGEEWGYASDCVIRIRSITRITPLSEKAILLIKKGLQGKEDVDEQLPQVKR